LSITNWKADFWETGAGVPDVVPDLVPDDGAVIAPLDAAVCPSCIKQVLVKKQARVPKKVRDF
jgi:hypothetical protein